MKQERHTNVHQKKWFVLKFVVLTKPLSVWSNSCNFSWRNWTLEWCRFHNFSLLISEKIKQKLTKKYIFHNAVLGRDGNCYLFGSLGGIYVRTRASRTVWITFQSKIPYFWLCKFKSTLLLETYAIWCSIDATLSSRGYFFLIDISRWSRANETQSTEEKKITSGHRSMQPHFHARNQFRNWTGSLIGYSHVKLFDVANQGHCYTVNSLRTWEYPISDPVQFLNWFLAWKWGCVLLWPEVTFFSSALCASLTRLRREISIRKTYPLEPRVYRCTQACYNR